MFIAYNLTFLDTLINIILIKSKYFINYSLKIIVVLFFRCSIIVLGEIMEIRLDDKRNLKEVSEYLGLDIEYLNDNYRIIFVAREIEIVGVIVFNVRLNNIEVCKGNEEIRELLIDKVRMIAYQDIVYDDKVIEINYDKRFNNYQEVYEFIQSQKDRVYSLDNFKRYMNEFCSLQNHLKTIHVCGTNGKGSTVNYLKEVLKLQGYRVGTFTTPALVSRLDIIRINDVWIDEEFVLKIANRYMDSWLEYEISLFEIEVFIALMYFIYQGVDLAIFEVGLGGELDATNIINPLVCVNTNIGLDHFDYLGDSYESITRAKAGIIKDGIDMITGENKQECLDIFKDKCDSMHSHLYRVGRLRDIQDGLNVKYTYKGYNIVLNTAALYQIKNSALALDTLLYLKNNKGINVDDENIVKGMYEANWAGRFEIISHKPLIILDGAHNKEGVDELYLSARKIPDLKIIYSALKDKDTDYMIERLLDLTYDITICEFIHPRSQKAKLLAKDYPVKVIEDYREALANIKEDDNYLITGSLYFISEVRKYLLDKFTGNLKKEESTF